jgi:hypothetical protein
LEAKLKLLSRCIDYACVTLRELSGVFFCRNMDRSIATKDRSQRLAKESFARSHVFVFWWNILKSLVLAVATSAEKWLRLQMPADGAPQPYIVERKAQDQSIGNNETTGVVASKCVSGEDIEKLIPKPIEIGNGQSRLYAKALEELLKAIRSTNWLKIAKLVDASILSKCGIECEAPKHLAKPCIRNLLDHWGRADTSKSPL